MQRHIRHSHIFIFCTSNYLFILTHTHVHLCIHIEIQICNTPPSILKIQGEAGIIYYVFRSVSSLLGDQENARTPPRAYLLCAFFGFLMFATNNMHEFSSDEGVDFVRACCFGACAARLVCAVVIFAMPLHRGETMKTEPRHRRS